MRIIILMLSGFLFLAIPCLIFAQAVKQNNNIEITRLADKIWLLKENHHFTANITLLAGPEGILLVDTGFRDAAVDLKKTVEKLSDKKVKYIISTHPNGDHVGGNSVFGKDVLIIGLKYGEDYYSRDGMKVKSFEGNYSFKFNGERIDCIPIPGGHTMGDIMVHFPDSKIACLGDEYLSESFPVVGTRGGARAQFAVRNLKKALEILPEDTKLVPGHGRVTGMEELKDYVKMIEDTIDIVRKEIDKGKSKEEIQKADVLAAYGQWGKFFSFITKDTWIRDIYDSYAK